MLKVKLDALRRWAGLCKIIVTIGLLIMISATASGAPIFKLKAPNEYFDDQKTLTLLTAALAGDLAKAKQLVSEGANPNDEGPRSNPYNRLRLLHYTIAAKNQGAVRVLMAVGADPELSVRGFGGALDFATTLQDTEMLSLLLDLRPLRMLTKDTVEELLFESITDNCPKCLELFLKQGAPVDLQDSAGYTVMMAAMDVQDYDMAEWLLREGASVNVETVSGGTPANLVEFHLQKFKPGSPPYNKVLHLKKMMEERGAIFPARSPAEIRAMRAKQ
jgi:uncharacterized protein